jgi:GT2 family glycosyltransferase
VSTSRPIVTFVVPCYKLAHLLKPCVDSILGQDYDDVEVLIMDDCSPDDTPVIARSFGDPRVVHVRNHANLGHVRNYNKGVRLARGKYVWLISADDYLRRPYVLRRYVELMERHPRVGYAFCSGVGVEDGHETGLIDYSRAGHGDRVMHGPTWLRRLLRGNTVLAASVMARRDCYEAVGGYPVEMPWANDWYMWCVFALDHDVAYFDEPMVCYRRHDLNMTRQLTLGQALACCEEEIDICWRVKQHADRAGLRGVSREALRALSDIYGKNAVSARFGGSHPILTIDQVAKSLCRYASDEPQRKLMRARVSAVMGNEHYRNGDLAAAAACYDAALTIDPLQVSVAVKRALIPFGRPGDVVRGTLRSLSMSFATPKKECQ